MHLRSRYLSSAVLILAVVASACAGAPNVPANGAGTGARSTGPSPSVVVTLHFDSFEPSSVTIRVGQTVEWKWDDAPMAHNVTFSGFSSPTQTTGTYFHTFTQAGTFGYRCTVHANMAGVVKVLT